MNIPPQDAAAIERYLAAIGHMEHSPMGAMTDRLELYSYREPTPATVRPDGHRAHCQCPVCTSGLSARPGCAHAPYAKDGPDDHILSRLWAGAVLAEIGRVDRVSEQAIRAWYGDGGALWSHHREGRLGCLLELTTSGMELLRRRRQRARGETRDVGPSVVIQTASVAGAIPEKKLIERARIEAVRVRQRAESAWADARAGRHGRSARHAKPSPQR